MGRYRPGSRNRSPAQIAESFWRRVDTSGGLFACWPWLGPRARFGHGRAWFEGRNQPAHRIAWVLSGRPLKPGLFLRHAICDNPPCVNPAHLAEGTHLHNMADMREHGRASRLGGDARGDRNGARRHPERLARGEAQPNAKLTAEMVRDVRRRFEAGGITTYVLADEYGVSQSAIAQIVRRASWRHLA